ncbi:hypothetical protein L6164_018000 [Bauhinia variegata]|uniref:Uncharacterized protein n=1 Tax=Bauhinia variegata TaxID=167791 RepID=A0ACB9N9U0_BAUVA|nr:hypothetical protein L6164_018000 [Bauhinia variegata]
MPATTPSSPTDPIVKKVADKLANFVAKDGRQFEDVTRQKKSWGFTFQKCADYKYYEYQLAQEEKALAQSREPQRSRGGGTSTSSSRSTNNQRLPQQHSTYQIPAPALYETADNPSASGSVGKRKRQPKQSKDEMPLPPSLQASEERGHHMGDYIPQKNLRSSWLPAMMQQHRKLLGILQRKLKFRLITLATSSCQKWVGKRVRVLAALGRPFRIQSGEVTPDDDIYEQYKKRMMLGHSYRPNPLNKPRSAY